MKASWKLTPKQREEIRASALSSCELARKYGVRLYAIQWLRQNPPGAYRLLRRLGQ